MGRREAALGTLLNSLGLSSSPKPPRARMDALSTDVAAQVLELHGRLGGHLESPRLSPGAWDLGFVDFVVELDEEQHFNRYREATLEPRWAAQFPWATDYLAYCRDHEDQCLTKASRGGYWTNTSCERLFGPGADPGDLRSAAGSPRWKQRALYDAIKDAYATSAADFAFARLSTHDVVDGIRLSAALDGKAVIDGDALLALLRERTIRP